MLREQALMSLDIRIHGDNVVEADRMLTMIAAALDGRIRRSGGSGRLPRYVIESDHVDVDATLLSGFGRWGVDLAAAIAARVGGVREAPDAYVTLVSDGHEEVILAVEFSSALPAGNQAWQRAGRAMTLARAGIPYLYVTDIGGLELGVRRRAKASRFPNPIVPFSFVTASRSFETICCAVYQAGPSTPAEIRQSFSEIYGSDEALHIVRGLLTQEDSEAEIEALHQKGLQMTRLLSAARARSDTLRGEQWDDLLSAYTSEGPAAWFARQDTSWSKKSAGKVAATDTYTRLTHALSDVAKPIGAGSIPIAVLPSGELTALAHRVNSIYNGSASQLAEWLQSADRDVGLILVTGFKPAGDDSRPDRGLLPLARMILGEETPLLTIVSGPAKPAQWPQVFSAPETAAATNGLWEAVLKLSDFVWIDSTTARAAFAARVLRTPPPELVPETFEIDPNMPAPSEHDVDAALHVLFTEGDRSLAFEGMCNPPGGDWSGLRLRTDGATHIWTSLPRVSGPRGKRPDHVIQFFGEPDVLLAIESKQQSRLLEKGIGDRLVNYTRSLIDRYAPVATLKDEHWEPGSAHWKEGQRITVISGVAFVGDGTKDFEAVISNKAADVVIAYEPGSSGSDTLHVAVRDQFELLANVMEKLGTTAIGIEVQIHTF